ncbi:MAG TPA: 50S ribosomal protein L21 [Bacteroidia bacterium]|nr:50S ribosomal protein L21 [Bacteroidia bacterium]
MYAIVEIAGLQYKVSQKQRVFVNRLEANEGDSIEFGKVLLIDNDGKITVGSPVIDGARVAAKVLSHLKGDKVIVFKKKRRKGYRKLNGHRQQLTELLIQAVLGKGEKLSAADGKLEIASILELKERSRLKQTKRELVPAEDVITEEDIEEVAEESEGETPKPKKKAAPKGKAKKETGAKKKPAAKKSTKKKSKE